MKVKLYINADFTHQGQRLEPVSCTDGDDLLEKLFDITSEGKTVTLIREGENDGINYMLTVANKDVHRKYIASIFAELTAHFKLSIP